MKPHDCNDFREARLESPAPEPSSTDAGEVARIECGSCAKWVERQARIHGELSALARLATPAGLEMRLILDFEHPEAPAVRELTALSRLEAPEELTVSLHARLYDQRDEPQAALAIRSAGRHVAPRVLTRLVREELEKSGAAAAERFTGDLERKGVPSVLEGRVRSGLAEPRRPRLLRAVAPLAVAAALVAVLAVARPWSPASAAESRPFEVVRLDRSAELSVDQRVLISGFSGVLSAVEPADRARVPVSRRSRLAQENHKGEER